VDVQVGRHDARYLLRRSRRSPRPNEVHLARQPSLLQVPHVSARAAERLESSGWSFVTDDGAALLQFPDGYVWRAARAVDQPPLSEAPAKLWSVGTSRVVHALLLDEDDQPPKQTSLAAATGLTQARVSGVVRELGDEGLVVPERGRPTVLDRDRMVDAWLLRRRFDPVVTYWAGGNDLTDSMDEVLRRFGAEALVSGDVAADAVAPHRRPQQVVVLARSGSLTGTALIPVLEATEATVLLAVTDDPVIWSHGGDARWRRRSIHVADPLQVLWDLNGAPGTDAAQAADQWRHDVVRSRP